jgi:hypothetical protein
LKVISLGTLSWSQWWTQEWQDDGRTNYYSASYDLSNYVVNVGLVSVDDIEYQSFSYTGNPEGNTTMNISKSISGNTLTVTSTVHTDGGAHTRGSSGSIGICLVALSSNAK